MAYELIETIEVGAGGASSLEFLSIPQDAVDLVLLVSARCSSTGRLDRDLYITYNSLTSGYSSKYLQGDGSTAYSGAYSGVRWTVLNGVPCANTTANTYNNFSLTFSNYATTAAKSASFDLVNENNGTESIQDLNAFTNTNTAAITSISLSPSADNFVQYSTASLYKIS